MVSLVKNNKKIKSNNKATIYTLYFYIKKCKNELLFNKFKTLVFYQNENILFYTFRNYSLGIYLNYECNKHVNRKANNFSDLYLNIEA